MATVTASAPQSLYGTNQRTHRPSEYGASVLGGPSLSSSAFHHHTPQSSSGNHTSSKSKRAFAEKKTSGLAKDHGNMSFSSNSFHAGSVPSNKLHKRGNSISSFHGPPSPLKPQVSTTFIPYDDAALISSPSSSQSATPKLKPYLRKMSLGKDGRDDQGHIDLSKSVVDNDRLAGLGIQESVISPVGDATLSHAARRGSLHTRTLSTGSQNSTASSHARTAQGFVHPMRQTPRPYTPPVTHSYASSLDEDEINESDDIVLDEELRPPSGFRNKRSMSLSSTAQAIPTPLSQSYTPADLHMDDALAQMPPISCRSQTNLSTKSGRSTRSSSNLRSGRPRRNTDRSVDASTYGSTRSSLDKAVAFVSRNRTDSDAVTRDERIRAARRKFEEKEALKDRKEHKKQDRHRLHAEISERRATNPSSVEKSPKSKPRPAKKEQKPHLRAVSYESASPSDPVSLPMYGTDSKLSEKLPSGTRKSQPTARNAQGGWLKFSTWFSTRMMNCASSRRASSA